MSKYQTVAIGALTMTDNAVTIASGKPLVLGGDASAANHAITKSQLDTVATELRTAINTIAGTDTALDTLEDMKKFVDGVTASGATDLLTAVTAETTARGVAVAAAKDAAAAALASADSSLRTLVSNEVATRTAEDTFLRNRLFHHVNLRLSPSLYADAAPPTPMPTAVSAATILDGMYYKNEGPSAPFKKINWYFAAPVDSTGKATAASLREMDFPVRLVNNSSKPFITVYTKPTGSNDDKSWYHSKYTYVANETLAPNSNYLFRALISGESAVGNLSNFTNVDLTMESFTSSTRPLDPTEEILFISIGTDSSAAAGRVECVIHGLYVQSTNGNVAYHLSNRDVLNKHIGGVLSRVLATLGQEPDVLLGIA